MGWKTAHYFAGFLSAGLATVIAVNTKASFLDSTTTPCGGKFGSGSVISSHHDGGARPGQNA